MGKYPTSPVHPPSVSHMLFGLFLTVLAVFAVASSGSPSPQSFEHASVITGITAPSGSMGIGIDVYNPNCNETDIKMMKEITDRGLFLYGGLCITLTDFNLVARTYVAKSQR